MPFHHSKIHEKVAAKFTLGQENGGKEREKSFATLICYGRG
jgi:hypothetical protein